MNPLKPVRFYGSALPRPRYYGDGTKERIDPPTPVNDSLLRWAADANWSMGGLSFKRQRMQGKIEGRLKKLKDEPEDDDDAVVPKKGRRKSKASPGKDSPETVSKKVHSKGGKDGDEEGLKRKEGPGRVRGRDGRGVSESPLNVAKRPGAAYPVIAGEWGEEDGPSPLRTSPRLHARSPIKPVAAESPATAAASNISPSIEFPIRRRQYERALPDVEDSDSDVNLEEFSLTKQPLRRSSRVMSIRRSFNKDFIPSSSEGE